MTLHIGAAILACMLLATAPAVRAEPDLSAPQAWEAARAGNLKLIDIRTPREWRETGIAPGAGRIDFYRGPEHLLAGVLEQVGNDRSAPIALICRTGRRTTDAQAFLLRQGFSRVYNIKEGMAGSDAGPGWIGRGLPLETCDLC